MKTEIVNTSAYFMILGGYILSVLTFIVLGTAIGSALYGIETGWYKGPEYIRSLMVLGMISVFLSWFFLPFFINKFQGSIEFTDDNIVIEKIKKTYKFQTDRRPIFNEEKQAARESLTYSQISSIQLLLDSDKEKPIYTREYFNGAENNWLIIKEKSGKIHKIEILIKSLEMEKAIINYLEQLKEKNIEISYGTKHKTFLHAIRCAF